MSLYVVYLQARMLIEDAKEKWLIHLQRSASLSTQAVYGEVAERFISFAPHRAKKVKSRHIEEYLNSVAKGRSGATVNLHLAALRSWFGWLNDNYELPNPTKRIRFKICEPPTRRAISKKEFDTIIVANPQPIKDVLLFLAHTGLRASELLNLKPSHIGKVFIVVRGKGNKVRRVPINKTIRSILKRNPHIDFLKSNNRTWLWRLCHKAAKNAEIKPFSPHDLRHYFCTRLHSKGVDSASIAYIAGHSSSTTLEQIYIDWSEASLKNLTKILD